MKRITFTIIIVAVLTTFPRGQTSDTADRLVLWRIVHEYCVPASKQGQNPTPCALVDNERGYAILKDKTGSSQFLLIATAKVSGIEDPELLKADSPNYFAEAWEARRFVSAMRMRDLPRDIFSLAVNSKDKRSQDQLHIHMAY